MLLALPKDVLEYILSLLVYDTFMQNYVRSEAKGALAFTSKEIQKNVQRMCVSGFDSSYRHSLMSTQMKNLSHVHPRIRKILLGITVAKPKEGQTNENEWKPKECFFHTLLSHSSMQKIAEQSKRSK